MEFRFRDGNSIWFPYSWLGTWKFNPSEGLLLKFSGDLVYLVLIKGSTLDRPLKEGAMTLICLRSILAVPRHLEPRTSRIDRDWHIFVANLIASSQPLTHQG